MPWLLAPSLRHHRPPGRGGEARPDRAHRLPWLAVLERGAHLFPDHGTRSLHRRIHLAVGLRHFPARRTTYHRGAAGGISGSIQAPDKSDLREIDTSLSLRRKVIAG